MSDPAAGDVNRVLEILTRPHTITTRGPHGELTAHEQPALIGSLRAAKTASVGRGSGSSTLDHERSALNLAAFQLYRDLERTVHRWARTANIPATGDPERLLTHWAAHADWHDLTRRVPQLREWIRQITDLLDPPPRWGLADPCPICHARWAEIGTQGHRERVDALQVTARTTIDHEIACRACGRTWIGLDGAQTLNALLNLARSSA